VAHIGRKFVAAMERCRFPVGLPNAYADDAELDYEDDAKRSLMRSGDQVLLR